MDEREELEVLDALISHHFRILEPDKLTEGQYWKAVSRIEFIMKKGQWNTM